MFLLSMLLVIPAYFVSFFTFYEAWVPIELEHYSTMLFAIGLLLLLVLPVIMAFGKNRHVTRRVPQVRFAKYVTIATVWNFLVFALFFGFFAQAFFAGELFFRPGTYRIQ